MCYLFLEAFLPICRDGACGLCPPTIGHCGLAHWLWLNGRWTLPRRSPTAHTSRLLGWWRPSITAPPRLSCMRWRCMRWSMSLHGVLQLLPRNRVPWTMYRSCLLSTEQRVLLASAAMAAVQLQRHHGVQLLPWLAMLASTAWMACFHRYCTAHAAVERNPHVFGVQGLFVGGLVLGGRW